MNNKNNQIKSPIVIKGDIFSDYLNCNSFQNSLLNKDFAKPDNETFDKFFNNDENSIKSYNSIDDYSRQYLSKPSISEGQMSNLFSINNSDFIYNQKDKINNEQKMNSNDDIKKKNRFNTLPNKEISSEEKKKKKLIMNRESAKKSRQKKKNYIENLEKQYMLLKEEFIKIREEQKLNNFNLNNQVKSNNQCIIQKQKNKLNEYNNNKLKKFGKKIIDNNNEFEQSNNLSNNLNNQKRLMIYLLINQIDVMTPIKIKSFQSKFLKMNSLDADDSIEVIKNKIDMNLNIIIELYGIETNNIPKIDFCNNKKSIAYQLYDYYKEVKSLVNKFEKIYNFENI